MLCIILSALFLNSCLTNDVIQIGDLKNDIGYLEETNRFALINPGTATRLYSHDKDNIRYLLSFDENEKVNYIIIDDKIFSTPEHLKKDDKVSLCIEKGGVLMVEEGVCYFILLSSGWFAYIDDINADVNNIYNLEIKFFYKKRLNDNYFFMKFEEYKIKRENLYSFDCILENKIRIQEPEVGAAE
jgi:hypothetical protein